MHSAFGYNHCRAINAKGIIFEGEFTPDSHAKQITKAPHLQGRSSKVTVRFSDFSGVPTIPDNIAWPDNRKRVLLGRLEIKRLTANTAEDDRRLVFNPSNVPTGIETAEMLSSFYSKAFRLSAEGARDVAPVARN